MQWVTTLNAGYQEKASAVMARYPTRLAVSKDVTAQMARKVSKRPTKAELESPDQTSGQVVLLSGGNPQIPKADGYAPVQAYIAAMPSWKSGVGRRLDALIVRNVPDVRKAVRWNSPFYGIEDQGWFISYHCFTKYVKVTFFQGASLRPIPPVESKHDVVRYFHIHENDDFDEELMADWIRQASALPGERLF